MGETFFVQGLPCPAPPASADESVSAKCVLPSCGYWWNTLTRLRLCLCHHLVLTVCFLCVVHHLGHGSRDE